MEAAEAKQAFQNSKDSVPPRISMRLAWLCQHRSALQRGYGSGFAGLQRESYVGGGGGGRGGTAYMLVVRGWPKEI